MTSSESTATLRQGGNSPQLGRPRGVSTSTLRASVTQGQAQSRVEKLAQASLFLDFTTPNWDHSDKLTSSFLSRSRSQSKSHTGPSATVSPTTVVPEPRPVPSDPPGSPAPASWWGRNRVTAAVTHVLGMSIPAVHEALLLTCEFLDVVPVPVPGLQAAAKILLGIWDSVQGVDLNRLACLRLTERCAEILLSVRDEIKDAGEIVGDELAVPIEKLVGSFTRVHNFMIKQAHRPFLKRYLKREEILRDITGCDKALGEALSMLGISIQIRILKQVQATELNRQSDTRALLESVIRSQQLPAPSALQGLGITLPTDTAGLPPSSSHKSLAALPEELTEGLHPDAVLPTLQNLHIMQNSIDLAHDSADLRTLMRDAVNQNSDAEMIRVLQVGREEFPEALKTLQRALERVGVVNNPPSPPAPFLEVPAALANGSSSPGAHSIERSISASSSATSGTAASTSAAVGRDMLDREFMESGIDALRRLSRGGEMGLPSWTITRYEVDRDVKIGMGFFSDVYRGTWRNRTVAIKVLAECTPRELFIKEVGIWKEFRHPHVLELYGASGASGEGPWFFVCPYEKHGCLSEFLRKVGAANASPQAGDGFGAGGGPGEECEFSWVDGAGVSGDLLGLHGGKETDLLRFMHEIAKGMDYLHSKGVLHGDLKAANILVDDRIHCLVSDFGQSEMKSEVFRISGTSPPHGTLRWQAPELMAGHCRLTTAMDVYSFAMCCTEILTMGRIPWPLSNDDDVRYFVTKENTRPSIPPSRYNTPSLQELLRICWHKDPFVRPAFSKIVKDVKQLRKGFCGPSSHPEDIPSPRIPEWQEADDEYAYTSRPSPDMHPIPLPRDSPPRSTFPYFGGSSSLSTTANSLDTSFHTARDTSRSPHDSVASLSNSLIHASLSFKEDTVATPCTHMTEEVLFTPSNRNSLIRASSSIPQLNPSEEDLSHLLLGSRDGHESPSPADDHMSELRNERRYRLLLSHEFHPSLTLPLWSPSPVSLGAVGYLSKPSGAFVTIFNCFTPEKSAKGVLKTMPSVHGYGKVTTGSQRQDKRNAAQRGLDAIAGLLTFKTKSEGPISQSVSRRYSFPLRTGHKAAYMCTETTMYRYVEHLDAAKKWFKSNIDSILEIYGPIHQIQKEDLFLVIGTLSAPDYALFVSHKHPDGQAHFNVFSSTKSGQPWGTFTTDTGSELSGPNYHEPSVSSPLSASKVSTNSTNNVWDTVLIARLRFKPDVLEPTSL
ncbi:Protein kinase domain-containing protein [Mycena sanguinolenta]|uniref:Protein kinase domain-containing protein n=1 Tax=Mycena sanguinolenta TaxID=230812 RepID=A0A8H7DJB9_9AGAR|nr:Protein kinase domain-containing protein [Mycena sanguinolenta]